MKKNNRKKELKSEDISGEMPGICQACGGHLHLEKVNLEDYQGGKLYMMEKVPAYVCQECGEVWVPEPILQEFEKMIEIAKQRKPKPTKRQKRLPAGRRVKGAK